MYYEAQNLIYARSFADAWLDAFSTIPTAKLIAAPTVRLLMGALPAITPDTTLAALEALEANFSGYGADTITLTVPAQPSTKVEGAIGSATFIAATASPFVSSNVSGYFLTDGTNLVAAEAFPNGQVFPIAAAGQFLTINVVLPNNLYQATS